jgi:mono/diheme cytochrome c family protein
MKSDLFKRLSILAGIAVIALGFLMLFTYQVIPLNWVDFMQIQPAFQPMYHPLPVPTDSIPIEGPAYVAALGAPANPIPADPTSLTRGAELFRINCSMCHGPQGKGDGPISTYLQNKPANLTGLAVQSLSDGALFMVVSNGVQGKMPALNENLTVRERWDVVNYLRTLK